MADWSAPALLCPLLPPSWLFIYLVATSKCRVVRGPQDDDVIDPEDCSWLPRLVAQFDAMPQLAMVGMNNLQLGHGEGNDKGAHGWLKCPKTGNNMIFAFQVGGWEDAHVARHNGGWRHVRGCGLRAGASDPNPDPTPA